MAWGTTIRPGEQPGPPGPVQCANCDIEIEGEPVERDDRTFCCDGCADGGPCVC